MKPYHVQNSAALYLGDCADLLGELPVSPDLILTSPPYGGLRDYGGGGFDFDRVADALVSVMPEGCVLVWVVGDQILDGGETGESFRQALGFIERGLILHDTMIFQKKQIGFSSATRYSQAFEFMFVFVSGRLGEVNLLRDQPNAQAGRQSWSGKYFARRPDGALRDGKYASTTASHRVRDNVWQYSTGHHHSAPDFGDAHQHPAIMPLALARDHIRSWTQPGDVVLDPMAGAGTTLRAALDLGRDAIGIEIHEPYCRLAVRRLSQQTLGLDRPAGQSPVRKQEALL